MFFEITVVWSRHGFDFKNLMGLVRALPIWHFLGWISENASLMFASAMIFGIYTWQVGAICFALPFCVIQRKRHEYIDLLILGWCAGCHSYGLRHSVLEQLYVGLLGMILQFHFRMADWKAPMLSPWDWRDCNIHTHISVILMFQFKPTQDIRSTQDGIDSSFQKTPYSKTSSYFYIWQAFTIWYMI